MTINPYKLSFDDIVTTNFSEKALQFSGRNTSIEIPLCSLSCSDFTLQFWGMTTNTIDEEAEKKNTILYTCDGSLSIDMTVSGKINIKINNIPTITYTGIRTLNAYRGYAAVFQNISGETAVSLYGTTDCSGSPYPIKNTVIGTTLLCSATTPQELSSTFLTDKSLIIGAGYCSLYSRQDDFMDGVVRNIGIWNGALTTSEIAYNFTNSDLPTQIFKNTKLVEYIPITDGLGCSISCSVCGGVTGAITGSYRWRQRDVELVSQCYVMNFDWCSISCMACGLITETSKLDDITGNIYCYTQSTNSFTVMSSDAIEARAVVTCNIDVSSNIGTTIDGILLNNQDNILLVAQTCSAQNGVYQYSTVGNLITKIYCSHCAGWTSDTTQWGGCTMYVKIDDGLINKNSFWMLRTPLEWISGCSLYFNNLNGMVYDGKIIVSATSCAGNIYDFDIDNQYDIQTYPTAYVLCGLSIDGVSIGINESVLFNAQPSGMKDTNGVYTQKFSKMLARYVPPCSNISYTKAHAWDYATGCSIAAYTVYVTCGYVNGRGLFELCGQITAPCCMIQYPPVVFCSSIQEYCTLQVKMAPNTNLSKSMLVDIDSIPVQYLDGTKLYVDDLVLLKEQTDLKTNGIYKVEERIILSQNIQYQNFLSNCSVFYVDTMDGTVNSNKKYIPSFCGTEVTFATTMDIDSTDYSVDLASTVPIPLDVPVSIIDNQEVQDNDYVLLTAQTLSCENGIYLAYSTGRGMLLGKVELGLENGIITNWGIDHLTAFGCSLPIYCGGDYTVFTTAPEINGITLYDGQIIYARDQVDPLENGLYSIVSTTPTSWKYNKLYQYSANTTFKPNSFSKQENRRISIRRGDSSNYIFIMTSVRDNDGLPLNGAVQYTTNSKQLFFLLDYDQSVPLESATSFIEYCPGKDLFLISYPDYKSGRGKVEVWFYSEDIAGYTKKSSLSGWQKMDFKNSLSEMKTYDNFGEGTVATKTGQLAFFYNPSVAASKKITIVENGMDIDLYDYVQIHQYRENNTWISGDLLLVSIGEVTEGSAVDFEIYEIRKNIATDVVEGASGTEIQFISTGNITLFSPKSQSIQLMDYQTDSNGVKTAVLWKSSDTIKSSYKKRFKEDSIPTSEIPHGTYGDYKNIVQIKNNIYGITELSSYTGSEVSIFSSNRVMKSPSISVQNTRPEYNNGGDVHVKTYSGEEYVCQLYPRIQSTGIGSNSLHEIITDPDEYKVDMDRIYVNQYIFNNPIDRGYDVVSREYPQRYIEVTCAIFDTNVDLSCASVTEYSEGEMLLIAGQSAPEENGVYYIHCCAFVRNDLSLVVDDVNLDQVPVTNFQPVDVATTTNICTTLCQSYIDIDGMRYFHDWNPCAATRILLTNQTTASENGIYKLKATGLEKEEEATDTAKDINYDIRSDSYYQRITTNVYIKLYRHLPDYLVQVVSGGSVVNTYSIYSDKYQLGSSAFFYTSESIGTTSVKNRYSQLVSGTREYTKLGRDGSRIWASYLTNGRYSAKPVANQVDNTSLLSTRQSVQKLFNAGTESTDMRKEVPYSSININEYPQLESVFGINQETQDLMKSNVYSIQIKDSGLNDSLTDVSVKNEIQSVIDRTIRQYVKGVTPAHAELWKIIWKGK